MMFEGGSWCGGVGDYGMGVLIMMCREASIMHR
jgi:hypothetical protein